jgi:hypothetical protein
MNASYYNQILKIVGKMSKVKSVVPMLGNLSFIDIIL